MIFRTKLNQIRQIRLLTTLTNTKVTQLSNRSLIRCSGRSEETSQFLQGLITNDIAHLDRQGCIYSFFLNKLGRVLYDSLVYKVKTPKTDENTYLIECDREIVKELAKHLKIYRVRKKIDIDIVDDELKLWNSSDKIDHEMIFKDPRIKDLGFRLILPDNTNLETLNLSDYKKLRFKLGVAEGITEILPGKSFPLECNLDYLHGVSFHKGCYIGQELTARTHHTGVVRKRIMPLNFESVATNFQPENEILDQDKKSVGKLRSFEGDLGIGLLRIDQSLAAKQLLVNGVTCQTQRPSWWPVEAKKNLPKNK